MKSIQLKAFCKCNLSLNITGKTGGMHDLDGVFMSLDAFDTVTVTERPDCEITVGFLNADVHPVNNTAYKAAAAVRDGIGKGVDIRVEKGIPIGAGLGGSSSDGAAVLRALDLFYGLPARGINMRDIALSVGSDVPFMLTGGLARVRGRGEDLFFIENKLSLFIVGLMDESVSTAAAYSKFDELYPSFSYTPTDIQKQCELLLDGDVKALTLCSNALYAPAAALAPSVRENTDLLSSLGAVANMTGSGGMTLGYFTDIDAFVKCVSSLKAEGRSVRVFAPAPTGILHRWISRE